MNELWIRRYHEASGVDAVPLVCLPYAGGGATALRPLSALLVPVVQPLVVQLPGRQDRYAEPCLDTIAELVEAIYGALGSLVGRPFAIFGHSMGAVLGFELARRVEREWGVSPVHLFVSGRRAPSCWRAGCVHRLSDAEVVAHLAGLNGTDPVLLGDPDIVAMVLPSVRADYRAVESYCPESGVSVGCPITVLAGDADPQTSAVEAAAWRSHTTGRFALSTYRGDHFFLNDHLSAIARLITDTLR